MTVQSAQPAQASQSPQSEQAAQPDIVYTWTDEAPMLATHSFLPIVPTLTPARWAKPRTIGRKEWVASIGASSVQV